MQDKEHFNNIDAQIHREFDALQDQANILWSNLGCLNVENITNSASR